MKSDDIGSLTSSQEVSLKISLIYSEPQYAFLHLVSFICSVNRQPILRNNDSINFISAYNFESARLSYKFNHNDIVPYLKKLAVKVYLHCSHAEISRYYLIVMKSKTEKRNHLYPSLEFEITGLSL